MLIFKRYSSVLELKILSGFHYGEVLRLAPIPGRQKENAHFRGTQRQFSENICSEDDLRFIIFGTFVVKFLAFLPLLGFSNI